MDQQGLNAFDFRRSQDLLHGLVRRQRDLEVLNPGTQPWGPQLIAAPTSPAYDATKFMGTYAKNQGWITVRFQMVIASWFAGSGSMAIRTPWVPKILQPTNQIVGSWWGSHSATYYSGPIITASTGAANTDFYLCATTGAATITSTSPWTWANGDTLSGLMTFELSPGY